ncbi:hypothetical protein JN11_03791 [Mucilaginibacter frigoritolerans]|uniref:YXWGXW repeat-containing protein n=1 Tax=Mucilaginibacter frigoritolerans TaxID=652788 RepID=A0A562TST5_9SPHI|nr:DUF6600 domain-containing protein [Mucilaginibacter frigoritolerans]TWI96679.1 hypothetical protein JN11_03791 [Mucilaginibacter frigoritolerans]
MKKIVYLIFLLSAALAGCTPIIYTTETAQPVYNTQPPPQQQPAYADQPQTNQVFYDELSPYGQWIDYPNYGYVWQPNVDPDFRPYETNGYWAYSDYGWTWVSNYSWGWATFHYGRWFLDPDYGWLWTPGQEWAPAWVAWGQSGDYYGWAPIPPGVNNGWRPRNNDWTYVDANHITQTNMNNYVVRNNVTVINNTTIINNTNTTVVNNRNVVYYNRGPRAGDVEHITNRSIPQIRINPSNRPGQSMVNGQLNVYQPVIKQNPNNGNSNNSNTPAPRKVIGYGQNNTGQNRPANQQNGRPGFGQGNNPNPSQPQNQQNGRPGNGQGNNPNPSQPANQQNGRPGNGQGNNPNPSQPANQQNGRLGNGQGNNPNPSQPQNQPNNSQGFRQGNNPGNNQQVQPTPRPVNVQNNNQGAQQPNQQQARPLGGQAPPTKPPVNKVKQAPKIITPAPVPVTAPTPVKQQN